MQQEILPESCDSNEIIFPSKHYMPKEITQQEAFLKKYPSYDGRNTLIAIFDTGVDPSLPGLQKTTTGLPKIVDCLDLTGAGDVDTSTVKSLDDNGIINGLTERALKIPKSWKNPSGKWHLGMKPVYELYSSTIQQSINAPQKEELQIKNKSSIAQVLRELNEHEKKIGTKSTKISDKEDREDILAKFEYLKAAEKCSIESPVADCIVWNDGDTWKACVDFACNGDLENAKVMISFRENREWSYVSDKCLVTYCITIHDDGNLLEICVPDCDHGSHVAHIAAGHFPDDPEKDGLAPGAQILSLRIIGQSCGTNQAFIRALNKCIELKADVINLSMRGDFSFVGSGNISKLIKNVVEKHGIIFVTSAGNDGAILSTVGFTIGKVHHSVINVGAYLTPEMKDAMYSHFGSNDSIVFPFSSRGPCLDGSLGVSIIAPGAAIAGVPKNFLVGSERMSGTSMSSPNACGNIACLISALKYKEIPISPYRIKLAIINSAMMPKNEAHDPFGIGHGILQLDSAFELIKTSMSKLPSNVTDIKIDIDGKRGIYLREKWQTSSIQEFKVSVTTEFKHFENLEERINFECPIILKLSEGAETFVKHPKYFRLPSGAFNIHIDPTKLEAGKVYYAEISGVDPSNVSLGSLFRVPITIIVAQEVIHGLWEKNVTLEPSVPFRCFISPPIVSTYSAFTISSKDGEKIPSCKLQCLSISCNKIYKKKHELTNLLQNEISFESRVHGGATMEICLIQKWENLKSANLNIKIKFFGYSITTKCLFASNPAKMIKFTNKLNHNEMVPLLLFREFYQPINVEEAFIKPLKERDYFDGHPSFCLFLTYKFKVTMKSSYSFFIDGLKTFQPYMNSFLLLVFTASKKLIKTSVSFKANSIELDEGEYFIHFQFQSFETRILDNLKNLTLFVKNKLPLFETDLYDNATSVIRQDGEKVKPKYYDVNQNASFYFASVSPSKLPTYYPNGSYLKAHFYAKMATNPIFSYPTKLLYFLENQQNNIKTGKISLEQAIETEGESEDKKIKIATRDLEISYITKHTDAAKALELFKKLSNEYPKHLPIFSAEIERLTKLKDLPKLSKMVQKLLEVSEAENVLKYFGSNNNYHEENSRNNSIMEKRKAAIIYALFVQANLALDEFLKNTEKDIPRSFRKGFDPKKKSNNEENKDMVPLEDASDAAESNVTEAAKFTENGKVNSTIFDNLSELGEIILTTSNENTIACDDKDSILNKTQPLENKKFIKTHPPSDFDNEKFDTLKPNQHMEKLVIESGEITQDSKITLDDIECIYRKYMLYAEATTENSQILIVKYAVAHGRYGIALAELEKIIATKSTTSDYLATEKAIIEVLDRLGWKHLADEERKALLLKHQKFYRLF